MNSKIFLKTACEILFKSMDAVVKEIDNDGVKEWKEVRRNTISKYLKNESKMPISSRIRELFLKRIEYYIYPEKYNCKYSEDNVIVFLEKAVYLFSTMFCVNFNFIKSDILEEYQSNVYNLTKFLTDLFSDYYECDKKALINFLMREYDESLSHKHSFNKNEIKIFVDNYTAFYNFKNSTQYNADRVKEEYHSAIELIDKQISFFETVLYEDKSSDYLDGESKNTYFLIRKYYEKYGSASGYKDWGYYVVDYSSEKWKEHLINMVFQQDIIFETNKLCNYIFDTDNCNFIEIMELFNKINRLKTTYNDSEKEEIFSSYLTEKNLDEMYSSSDLKKYQRVVDRNSFVIHNSKFIELYDKLIEIKNYISLKKQFDCYINLYLLNEIQ